MSGSAPQIFREKSERPIVAVAREIAVVSTSSSSARTNDLFSGVERPSRAQEMRQAPARLA